MRMRSNGPMTQRPASGFSVVELIITLAVAGILGGMAVPALREVVADQRSAAVLNTLIGAIAHARALAIDGHRVVTLCPAQGRRCAGRDEWHLGALIYFDDDRNGHRGANEHIVSALPALTQGQRIYWRSFRNRSYLQFTPRGYTDWQNGHFLYCPQDGSARQARVVIINAAGRTRPGRDRDGDRVVEDARGQPVACP